MMTTLSFVDRLFAHGLELENRGLRAEACTAYQRLLRIRPLTRMMVGEVAGKLGKLQLERGQFARARRNLTLAAVRLPRNADYQNLLARAIEADETCAFEQAEQPLRNCVNLQPYNPVYVLDLARHLGQRGQNEEALDLFRQAFDMAGDNPEVVGLAAEGVRDLGEAEEAQALLRQAQFRHGRDARFRQLLNEHQFQTLWARQQKAQGRGADEIGILRFVPRIGQLTGSAS